MSPRVPAAAAVLGLQVLLFAAAPALAHVDLVSSDPAAGSTVTDVDTVTLVFSEALKESASSFKLAGPGGSAVGTGTVTGPRRMVLDAPGGLPPGAYTVKWTAAGTDGHIERGTVSFTVAATEATEPPVTPEPSDPEDASPPMEPSPALTSAGPTVEPDVVDETPGPSADSPSTPPAPDPASATIPAADVLVPLVAGLAIVAVVGFLALRRTRRS